MSLNLKRRLLSPSWRAAAYFVASVIVVIVPFVVSIVSGGNGNTITQSNWLKVGCVFVFFASVFVGAVVAANEYNQQMNLVRGVHRWNEVFAKILMGRISIGTLFLHELLLGKETLGDELHTPERNRKIRISIYLCNEEESSADLVYSNEEPQSEGDVRSGKVNQGRGVEAIGTRLRECDGLPGVVLAGLIRKRMQWGSDPKNASVVVFRWGPLLDDGKVVVPLSGNDRLLTYLRGQQNKFVAATSFKYRGQLGIVVLASTQMPDPLKQGLTMKDVLNDKGGDVQKWLKDCAINMRLLAQSARQMMRLARSAANAAPDSVNLNENYQNDRAVGHVEEVKFSEEFSLSSARCDGDVHTLKVYMEGHEAIKRAEEHKTSAGGGNVAN